LLAACAGGSVEAAESLLEFRADVNVQDQEGNTPLIAAADEGMVKMVRWLLKHHCNPCIASKDGATALMAASFRGSAQACDLLLAGQADPNQEADQGWTALLAACQAGHTETAKRLLDAGAQLDHKSADGDSAQQLAAQNGKREIVKLLETRIQLDKRRASMRGATSQVDSVEDTRDLDGLLRDLGEAPSGSKKKQARGKKKATAANTQRDEATPVSTKPSTVADALTEASSNVIEARPAETTSAGTSMVRSSKKKAKPEVPVEKQVETKLGASAGTEVADGQMAEVATDEVADMTDDAVVTNASAEAKSLRARLKEIDRVRADLDAYCTTRKSPPPKPTKAGNPA